MIVPVTTGATLSPTLSTSVTVVWLLQASVMVYVRVITSGQVPVDVSVNATTKLASVVQLSEIVIPNVSSPATVVCAAGAAVIEQPDRTFKEIVPVTTGEILSPTFII